MNLKTYTENLNKFLTDNPDAADYTVITAADDEGNGYNEIHYSPSLGHFDSGDFEVENVDEEQEESNSVCVN